MSRRNADPTKPVSLAAILADTSPAAAPADAPVSISGLLQQEAPRRLSTSERVAGALQAPLQGLTMGAADEIAAPVAAAGQKLWGMLRGRETAPFAEMVQREQQGMSRAHREFQQAQPFLSGALEGAGSVAPVLASAGMATPATLAVSAATQPLRRRAGAEIARGALRAATQGATQAAAAGFLSAEGGVGDRALAGALSAPFGAGLGGAASLAGPAVAGAVGRVRNLVTGHSADNVAARGNQFLLRDIREGGPGVPALLDQYRSGQLPRDMPIAEAVPTTVGNRLRDVRVLGGRAGSAVERAMTETRQAIPANAARSVDRAFGSARPNAPRVVEELAEQARTQSAPHYAAAYAAHPVVEDPRIEQMVRLPFFDRAWDRAQMLAALDEQPLPQVFQVVRRGNAGVARGNGQLNEALEMVDVPDLRSLHYLRQGLDDVIEYELPAMVMEGGTNPTVQGRLRGLRGELNGILHRLSPELERADLEFGTRADQMRAFQRGQRLLRQDATPDILAAELADLAPASHPYFRLGAQSAVREKMSATTDGRDVIDRVWASDALRGKYQNVLPEGGYAGLERDMTRATGQRDLTRRVLNGPNTADKTVGVAELQGGNPSGVVGDAMAVAGGNPLPVVNWLAGKALDARAKWIGQRTGDVYQQRALSPDPMAVLTELLERPMGGRRYLSGPAQEAVARALGATAGMQR